MNEILFLQLGSWCGHSLLAYEGGDVPTGNSPARVLESVGHTHAEIIRCMLAELPFARIAVMVFKEHPQPAV